MHAQRWNLPHVHVPLALRREHLSRAGFAVLVVVLGAACAQAAKTNVLLEAYRFAAQPYWWFVENITAYCAGGFAR